MKTVNEAVAGIKYREDALHAIDSLYGTFETERGTNLLLDFLEDHRHEILDWIPDEALIELAQTHVREEWRH